MLNVLKYLTSELKKICPRTFNDNVNENTIFPYVAFRMPNSTIPSNDSENIYLEIDIWDYARENYDATYNVEVLTNRIEKFLKENRHLDENQLLIFSKTNRLSIRDEDANIKRRQLRYTVKYYDRNQ